MTFVVTENCIRCKSMECVKVCPVDCFHEAPLMLVIDPDECIGCTLCEPECPTEAIFSADELPDHQKGFLQINQHLSKLFPVVTEEHETFTDAASWKDVRGKAALLGLESAEVSAEKGTAALDKYEKLFSDPIRTESEWAARLTDPNPLVRLAVTTRNDFALTPARLSAGLQDADEYVRYRYVSLGVEKLTPMQVESLIKDPSRLVRKQMVEKCADRFTPAQIDRILGDSDASVRVSLIESPTFRPSVEQFRQIYSSGSPTEQIAVLERIHADIQPLLLDHPDRRVRASAFARKGIKLNPQQIEAGLADPSGDVVYSVVSRSDVKITAQQFIDLLGRSDPRITYAACQRSDGANVDALIAHSNDALIAEVVEFLPDLTAAQVDRLISDGRWRAVRALFKFKPGVFTPRQLDRCRAAPDWGVRHASITATGVGKIPVSEIGMLLKDRTEKIRVLVVGSPSVRLSKTQMEAALTDPAMRVRFAAASREDFRPTLTQYRRGLRDTDPRIKALFKRRFTLQGGKIVSTGSVVRLGGSVLRDELRKVLDELSTIPTWTKRKHELKKRLEGLVAQLRYTRYHSDGRKAPVNRFGAHVTISVPLNKRGALQPMRGKAAHIICIGHGLHSTVYLAAKAI
jgi:ferredoxin